MRLARLAILIIVSAWFGANAAGPQVGGFGLGGNPRPNTNQYAFFEFAPASGAGMTDVCACAAVTGAKGEAMTFSRASTAYCTKAAAGGLSTTGLVNGDMVLCAANQPRVEYDSDGVRGLRVEGQRTNSLLRSEELDNAVWTNVGTPAVVSNAVETPWDPMFVPSAETLTDDSTTAFEGRQQAVAVTLGSAYTMSCYLSSAGATTARLSLDGTTCDVTGLSNSTWTRASCTDASASGVTIVAQVLVGNAVSVTGSIHVGGCQVEGGSYATSYIPTVAVSATRSPESPSFMTSSQPGAKYSISGNFTRSYPVGLSNSRVAVMMIDATHYVDDYFPGNWTAFVYDGAAKSKTHSTSVTTSGRVGSYYDGTSLAACVNGACESVPVAVSWPSGAVRVRIGVDSAGGVVGHLNGIISRVCADPSPTRCR